MPRYLITYLDPTEEQITADTIEPSNGQYIAYQDNKPTAWIPTANVRSIVRQNEQETST
ncbi:hypothetical protein [Streptomyces misionensis]|uniref:hypothetical protein n=1 Tax=Streptomyces misionensis TaxID=67331 RepID=UPI00396BC666